jgi:hypothetical protein
VADLQGEDISSRAKQRSDKPLLTSPAVDGSGTPLPFIHEDQLTFFEELGEVDGRSS